MDLQEKLNEITKKIEEYEEQIIDLQILLKAAKRAEKQYGKLIEKAKALEQK